MLILSFLLSTVFFVSLLVSQSCSPLQQQGSTVQAYSPQSQIKMKLHQCKKLFGLTSASDLKF